MIITGFDGKQHKLNFGKFKKNSNRNKSKLHENAICILQELFPGFGIYEEVTLPGSKRFTSKALYADIILPHIPMMVEVHGQQHYRHIPFFHKTKMEFVLSQRSDKDKIEWCNINNFTYVALPYNMEHSWKEMIQLALMT